MAAVFITGTGTDVGKTYVTAGLIRGLVAEGHAVDALKPVVSGFDAAAPAGSDPAELLAAMGRDYCQAALERISPWRFTAPLSPPLAARLEGRVLPGEAVIDLCRARIASAGQDLLLIEGAGGVMSPLDDSLTMLDLARRLEASVLLVAGSYLGTISHTLTAVLALRSAGRAPLAIVVAASLDAPPLEATIDDLSRFVGDIPVFAVLRGGEVPAALVRRLGALGDTSA